MQGGTAFGTAGLGGSSLNNTGLGNVSTFTGSLPTNSVNLTGNGLSATTPGDASLLRATGTAQAQDNLGPVSLTGNATGSVDVGRFTQQGRGSLQFGPNGLQAQAEFNQRLAIIDAQGSVNGSAQGSEATSI